MSEGIETVVSISGKFYRAIVPRPDDFTLERPILAIWPDELTEAEAERLWEKQQCTDGKPVREVQGE